VTCWGMSDPALLMALSSASRSSHHGPKKLLNGQKYSNSLQPVPSISVSLLPPFFRCRAAAWRPTARTEGKQDLIVRRIPKGADVCEGTKCLQLLINYYNAARCPADDCRYTWCRGNGYQTSNRIFEPLPWNAIQFVRIQRNNMPTLLNNSLN
jgi:hypothetical protein